MFKTLRRSIIHPTWKLHSWIEFGWRIFFSQLNLKWNRWTCLGYVSIDCKRFNWFSWREKETGHPWTRPIIPPVVVVFSLLIEWMSEWRRVGNKLHSYWIIYLEQVFFDSIDHSRATVCEIRMKLSVHWNILCIFLALFRFHRTHGKKTSPMSSSPELGIHLSANEILMIPKEDEWIYFFSLMQKIH